MDLSTAALLAASGLAAGLVNAIAGGGTFFTFSALVAAGLPPVVANATSAVAVTPANLASAWAYRQELLANLRRFAALGLVSLSGGLIGAYILTVTDNASFRQLVPWLLLFATLLFAASPKIVGLARSIARHEGHVAYLVPTQAAAPDGADVLAELVAAGVHVTAFEMRRIPLDEIFVQVYGHDALAAASTDGAAA